MFEAYLKHHKVKTKVDIGFFYFYFQEKLFLNLASGCHTKTYNYNLKCYGTK